MGRCAETLAQAYSADVVSARVAGILHDWEKLLPDAETQIELAERFRIRQKLLIRKLLDSYMVAAKTLPAIYPLALRQILSAIQKHTAGDRQMSKNRQNLVCS